MSIRLKTCSASKSMTILLLQKSIDWVVRWRWRKGRKTKKLSIAGLRTSMK